MNTDNTEQLKNIAKALCAGYDAVLFLRLSENTACIITDGSCGDFFPLDRALNDILPNALPESDRKKLIRSLSAENIAKRLSDSGFFSAEHTYHKGSELNFIHLKIISVDKDSALICSCADCAENTRNILDAALSSAKKADTANRRLLADLSHEVRTQLTAIIGFANLASAKSDVSPEISDYLHKITSSSDKLLDALKRYSGMNRTPAAKSGSRRLRCSLISVLRSVYSTVNKIAAEKDLSLYMDAADIINDEVYCDKTLLIKLLLQLVSNAIKFTKSGGNIYVRLTERSSPVSGHSIYEFHVIDTGIGMSEEFIGHIFEPFARETTHHPRKIEGTGLGYTRVKHCIDNMGGSIQIHSEEGKGTDVEVSLSLEYCGAPCRISHITALEGSRALVFGKSFDTCECVTKMLNTLGITSEWTMDLEDATLRLRHAAEDGRPFSLCVINIGVRRNNVNAMLEKLRRIHDFTAVIAAHDLSTVPKELSCDISNVIIQKPVIISELAKALSGIVPADIYSADAEEHSRKRILIVEDEELNRELVSEILSRAGYMTDSAVNGREAVNKLASAPDGHYQLVLMDLRMPVMDGYHAAKIIHGELGRYSSLPIIAMSADTFEEDIRKAAECGMDVHIPKPIDITLLLNTVNKMIK